MPKPDPGAGARRGRFLTAMGLQGLLAALLLGAGLFSWGDRPTDLLYLWTLVIPLGVGAAYLTAYRRGETARKAGAWTPASEQAEGRRAYAMMGASFLVWGAGALAIVATS